MSIPDFMNYMLRKEEKKNERKYLNQTAHTYQKH